MKKAHIEQRNEVSMLISPYAQQDRRFEEAPKPASDPDAAIKAVAGMIAKLSYRDAMTIGRLMWVQLVGGGPYAAGPAGIVGALLTVSDKILSKT